jgi:hypothetical protein
MVTGDRISQAATASSIWPVRGVLVERLDEPQKNTRE